jgi:tetratricopeptide (TPR) repeat protein
VAARLADAARDVLGEEMLRLSIMAALDAGAWAQAERGLETWRARGLDTTWWLLKTAERVLGAEGRLPTDLRAALDASATSAPSDELTVRIAQGLAADGLVEEGLRRLGWPALDAATPVGVREAAVGLLLRAGRPADALALLPVLDGQGWPPRLQTLRARALEALGRHDEARTATEALPATARRADDWIRLARLTSDARAREGVLADALTRWPASADLWAAVATTRQHLGQPRQARDAALQALAINPGQLEAWRVRLALPPATDAARAAELAEAGARFATQPDVRVDLAEAAMTTGLEDGPSVAVVHEWLADPDATTAPGRVLRLRARLAAATGQWQGAIDAVAAARLRDPGDISLRHLDAQLHAWSGRHDEAARRFETYLTRVPTDGTAWREYARLLSWMQRASASQAAYARAGRLMDAPALAAERSTKAALARQAWRRASIEAASWLALEPTSLDARVDRALALDRSGALDAAAPLFAALATAPSLPNDLRDSAARYGRRHRVTGTVQMVVESTAGFGDQRLLEQQVTVAGVSDRVGVGGRTLLMADVARGTLDARDAAWTLTEMRTGAETRVGGGWQLSTHTSLYALGRDRSPSGPSRSRHLFALRGALDGTLVDGLRVTLAAERRPFWENGATVQTGLSGFGGTGALEWTPSARWMARAAGTLHGLTDGNRRHEASGSLALRGTRGARDLQLRSSVLLFGYDASRAAYFSPRRFVRTDLEGEVRHWVGRPRSDGDRRAFLSGSLGMGVDSRQARYGLGSALVSVPIGRRWSVEGEGRWVQASVYQSSRVAVWLRLGSGL